MSDQITLSKDEAEKTADYLWQLLARIDNDCHPDRKQIEEIENLANILEGRRPCPECGDYFWGTTNCPRCCDVPNQET